MSGVLCNAATVMAWHYPNILAEMHLNTYLLENYINVRVASRNHILGKFPFDKIANIASRLKASTAILTARLWEASVFFQ